MTYTDFEILNDPTVRHHAMMLSKWAVDISYKCPKCGNDRVVTWLFPDQDMRYEDECCKTIVKFKAYEEGI